MNASSVFVPSVPSVFQLRMRMSSCPLSSSSPSSSPKRALIVCLCLRVFAAFPDCRDFKVPEAILAWTGAGARSMPCSINSTISCGVLRVACLGKSWLTFPGPLMQCRCVVASSGSKTHFVGCFSPQTPHTCLAPPTTPIIWCLPFLVV